MIFVDRRQELEVLEGALSASSPGLFVLYGRRRVGKTALLHRACSDKRHVFFTADLADLKRPATRIDLALFSRSGFTSELRRQSRARDDVRLFTVEEMLGGET